MRQKDWYLTEEREPGFFHCEDYEDASFYLLEGTEKALLIDTGMGEGDFRAMLKKLTDKPIELAVTHAHVDHFLHACLFRGSTVYMHPRDTEKLDQWYDCFASDFEGRRCQREDFTPITEDSVIDLGGGYTVRVLEIPGHTPGSVAFYDEKRELLFTGDAIGSGIGVWMVVPGGTTLSEYRDALLHLAERLRTLPVRRIYGGHLIQEGEPGTTHYNPLTLETITDMAQLCEKVLAGEIDSTPANNPFDEDPAFRAELGKASMEYRLSQIR